MGQAPPPFQANQYKRKSNTGLIVAIVAACIIIPCGLCGLAGYWFWGKAKSIAACTMDFEAVRKGINDYANDHDGKFPDAAKWQDEVRSYFARDIRPQDRQIIGGMDTNGQWGCKTDNNNETGMAFNSELSGKPMKDIKDPYSTVLIYEIPSPSTNANGPYKPNSSPGPTFMGRDRGWVVVNITGAINMGSRTQFNFNEGTSGGSDNAPPDSGIMPAAKPTGSNSGTNKAGSSKGKPKSNGVDDE